MVILAGGAPPTFAALEAIPPDALLIAVDSGADHALSAGLRIDLAVGDFDSISATGLTTLARESIALERHPEQKDATDLELALEAALSFEPRRVLVVGGTAGRLDHLMAEFLLLGSPMLADVEVDALLGTATLNVVRGERSFEDLPGTLVSLMALHGPAVGVVTEGFTYPLADETLLPGSTRGVSNTFEKAKASVRVREGVLIVVRPGTTRV